MVGEEIRTSYKLGSRQAEILEAAVREFIRTGRPVSSGMLYRRYQFGIKPARIRSELHELTARGFLRQAYRSSGRVPSDLGYIFYAHGILSGAPSSLRNSGLARLARFFSQLQWEQFLQHFSSLLGLVGVIEDLRRGEIKKGGIARLVERLDWQSAEEVRDVVWDFEQIDRRLPRAVSIAEQQEDVAVFVGSQSPLTESDQLSVLLKKCEKRGNEILLVAVGPKRMDYQKVITLLRNL